MRRSYYEVGVGNYTATEDSYEHGEVGGYLLKSLPWNKALRNGTIQGLIEIVVSSIGADADEVSIGIAEYGQEELNSYVRLSWMEDVDGNVVSPKYNPDIFENWKAGKDKLWACEADLTIYKIVADEVSADELRELGYKTL